MKTQIAIIDYGMGNLHSVASALHHVAPEADVRITSDPAVVADADRVIFPGVGAMRDCMAEIRRLNFDRVVSDTIASGKPVLAICVGLQALLDSSEENGGVRCLGHFGGQVCSFANSAAFIQANQRLEQVVQQPERVLVAESSPAENGISPHGRRLKVPHMGWNQVEQTVEHPLWSKIADFSRFYFVHSYFVQVEDSGVVAGSCHYGLTFTAAVQRANVFAVQFHPEKSHDNGLQLLKNFVAWNGQA